MEQKLTITIGACVGAAVTVIAVVLFSLQQQQLQLQEQQQQLQAQLQAQAQTQQPEVAPTSSTYEVQFFVTNPHLLGKDVFVKAGIDNEQQAMTEVISETVNTEKIIAQDSALEPQIATLTVSNNDGQHPDQVWACVSAENALTSPGCQRLVLASSIYNLYLAKFDYNEIVKDLQ